MNRRQFLQRAALAAAALTLDPEQLLWTPGRRTYIDLGPLRYRVMLGDWGPVSAARLLDGKAVLTVYGGAHHGVTIFSTPQERAGRLWPYIEARRIEQATGTLAVLVKDYNRKMHRM